MRKAYVQKFSTDDPDIDTQINAWLAALPAAVVVTTYQLPYNFILVVAAAQAPFVPIAALPSEDPTLMRQQLFTADTGGGTLLDYTTGADETIALKLVRVTTAAAVSLFRMYVNGNESERVAVAAGIPWHFPQDDIFLQQTSGILGFPGGVVPPNTEIEFTIDAGPCAMRIWWELGPTQF